MRSGARLAILLALALCVESLSPSTFLAQDSKETGAVTGRVLVDGKPAQGIVVMASVVSTDPKKLAEEILKPGVKLKAVTDSEGRYRFEALSSGRYVIAPSAPTLVTAESDSARQLNVAEGATLEDINFSMSRGGVITGKITDSDGNPVIAEELSLKQVESAIPETSHRIGGRMYVTDDRGIYRIYGLAPGKYIVSAGAVNNPITTLIAKRPKRVQTFYPGVTDEAKAKPVDVIAGAESSGVDIKLGLVDKGFTVSGRVLTAETGTPIANAMIAYGPRPREGKPGEGKLDEPDGTYVVTQGGMSLSPTGGMTTTNAKGEFRLESLSPGRYKLEVESMGGLTGTEQFYADPVNFEVQSANVDKLEIKVHLGASISGSVVMENADTPTPDAPVPFMLVATSNAGPDSLAFSKVAADGSFRIGGLKAGKTTIQAAPYGTQKLSILRIEQNGILQSDGIVVQANEQITGVRIVLTPANCVIVGHVTIQGGTLSPDADVTVWARPLNSLIESGRISMDTKGDFTFENLAPGNYEVEASVNLQSSGGRRRVSAKQTVSVISGTPSQTNLVLDLGGKDK